MINDTIAAIASGITSSGVGVIRISGPDAFAVADKIFFPSQGEKDIFKYKPYTMHYGYICDEGSENTPVDEVVLLIFKGPKSFTGEDVIEIDCHGGIFVMNKILSVVLKNGARLAEPGEFSKRAFFVIGISKDHCFLAAIAEILACFISHRR